MSKSRRTTWLLLLCLLLTAVTRIALVSRQALWADEIFSVAIATGHSLEQPADQSRPELGDYFESPEPQSALHYRKYLENEHTSTVGGVIRAVFLSDSSPPLYYLLLHGWTLAFGSSDSSLRILSVLWSLLTIPLIFLIGRRFNGPKAGLLACGIFAFASQALYYSTEGRMYSMVWFLVCAYAYAMLRLHDDGVRWVEVLTAILAGAGGLLTHYFFLFPWSACTTWLGVEKGRAARRTPVLIGLAILVLVSPWYAHLPASFRAWRVTGYWLYLPNTTWSRPRLFIRLVFSFFVAPSTERIGALEKLCVLGVMVVACVRRPHEILNRRSALLCVWLLAALLAPLIFDLLLGTFTVSVDRYVLAGLPAAFILFAVCLLEIPVAAGITAGAAIATMWLIADRNVFISPSRQGEPYNAVVSRIEHEWPRPDLVVLHTIPSGVLGIARYLHSDIRLFSWVGQLGVRSMPTDITEVTAGARKVVLVKIHCVGEPAPEERWLRSHATRLRTTKYETAEISTFQLTPRVQDTASIGASFR